MSGRVKFKDFSRTFKALNFCFQIHGHSRTFKFCTNPVNKIVITKVALILNVRKLIVYILNIHAVTQSRQVQNKYYQWIVLYTFKPSTYRVHSLEKYSIFSTSAAIDQKTRSVHIYGHLNTYILLFDYRTLLVYTLQQRLYCWHSKWACLVYLNAIG
jgi:hypothetical protein